MVATDFAEVGAARRADTPRVVSPWLSGRSVDLLFGYGLAYILTIPLLLYAGQRMGLREWPAGLVSLFSLAVAAPHYGATLLRAYHRRADRQRYAFFTVYASVFLVVAYAAGLYHATLGSLLLTLYVTWSPWHFAGQNYGLALMSLRRRGVSIGPDLKRPIYASFILSAAIAILSLHAADAAVSYSQGYRDESGNFGLLRLGIPLGLVRALAPVLALAYLGTLFTAARRLLRADPDSPAVPLRDLAPALLLVVTQALWFALPGIGWATGYFSLSSLPFAAIWLSVAHSIQYLWVTNYYARRSESRMATAPFLFKSMLAGTALSILPALLFVPGLLGGVAPFSAGATVLLFAVVNLHHFLLDGALWKLRDGRVARVLLQSPSDAMSENITGDPIRAKMATAFRGLLWTLGLVALAVPFFVWREVYAGGQLDGSVERSETAVRRLAWLGRDNPQVFSILGWHYEQAGDPRAAINAYRKSATLSNTPLSVADRLAWLLVVHEPNNPKSRREAVAFAEAASAARANESAAALHTLSVAYANAGRTLDAQRIARLALVLAHTDRDDELAARIRAHAVVLRNAGEPSQLRRASAAPREDARRVRARRR